MTTLEKLKKLQTEALKSGRFDEIEKFTESDEYQKLSYAQKNSGFITSHKLLEFERCGYCYNLKFVELAPDPTEGENDAFILGDAFDTLISRGHEAYEKRFEVVSRRLGNTGKVELTPLQGQVVGNMHKGYLANPLFVKNIKRRTVITKLGNRLLKAEMDHCGDDVIMDIKTTASISRLDFYDYAFQLSFYQMICQERDGKQRECYLNMVDKYKYFSRSRAIKFTESTLFYERRRIIPLLDRLVTAEDTGMFLSATRQEVLDECPFYGHDAHGIPHQYLYI